MAKIAVGTGLAAVGGGGMGAAAYALESAALSPLVTGLLLAIGGAAVGFGASYLHPGLGAGIAGSGAALGAGIALRSLMEPAPETTGFVARQMTPGMRAVQGALPSGQTVTMRAVQGRVGNRVVTMR